MAARLASARIRAVSRALLPLFLVSFVVLLLITYIPVLPMGLVWLTR